MTEQVTTQMDDVFAQALAKRKQQEQEQEAAKNTSSWSGDFEEIQTVGLVAQKEIVGRIVGNPIEQRKNPTDPKLILQSQIVKPDKKGYIRLNWPMIEKSGKYIPDPDWIVTKFYNKVNEGRWVKYSEGILKDKDGKVYPADYMNAKQKNGEWVKSNSKTKVFEEVDANSKTGELYPKSFYPSKRVVANWIDRHDDWCKENKHFKILTAKKTPYEIDVEGGGKKTIYFEDTGIPSSLYDKIFEHCSAVGTMDIDLVITKIEKDYKVFDITDYPKYVSKSSSEIGVKTRISEEEKTWTMYDLDKLYKVSSYRKIQKYLAPLFKLCDAELGTSFEKELDELVRIEKETYEAEKEVYYINEVDGSYGTTTKEDIIELIESDNNIKEVSKDGYDIFVAKQTGEAQTESKPVEEPKVEVKTETKRRELKTEVVNSDIESLCKQNFPSWDKLSEEDQKFMVGFIIKFDGTIPVYKNDTPLGCNNTSCFYKDSDRVTLIPLEVNVCPVCGAYLGE